LAATTLPYDEFLHVVRTAVLPKPAYPADQVPDQAIYDIYAWVRTQIPLARQVPSPSAGPATGETPSLEEMRSMTIWACRGCDTCHGVFAQGGPDGPPLAGLNDPVEKELAKMRGTADTISEHGADHISDEIFKKLYEWLKMGCVKDECYQ
jgi:mono/diheme cytochrome c family protein